MNTSVNLINKAKALHNSGDIQGAYDAYQKLLAIQPSNTDALNGMGVLSLHIGNAELAEKFLARAVKKNKKEPVYLNNLALAQQRLGKHKVAISNYNKALKINKQYVEALNNLSALYLEIGRYNEAIPLLQRAIRNRPDYANAHSNLGVALHKSERHKDAIIAFKKALECDHTKTDNYTSLAVSYNDLGKYSEAIASAKEAINSGVQGSNLANAYNTLGLAYSSTYQLDDAYSAYTKSIEIIPDSTDSHYNLGTLLLLRGELDKAWKEYSWRLKQKREQLHYELFPQQTWHGESLQGKSISILAEQGLGDEILFANIFPEVVKDAEQCTIECDKRLLGLFSRSFPNTKLIERKLPPSSELVQTPSDYKATPSQLAAYYRNEQSKFPSTSGYLTASPERIEHWRKVLNAIDDRPKVGICWRSMLMTASRSKSYTSIEDWFDLFRDSDYTFVNLQYDNCTKELARVKSELGVTVHELDIDLLNNLDDTAALTVAVDAVVSVGTSVAAMAGALGKKTILLTTHDNWTRLGTDHIPWYPNTQAIFKSTDESWHDVFGLLKNKLPSVLKVE